MALEPNEIRGEGWFDRSCYKQVLLYVAGAVILPEELEERVLFPFNQRVVGEQASIMTMATPHQSSQLFGAGPFTLCWRGVLNSLDPFQYLIFKFSANRGYILSISAYPARLNFHNGGPTGLDNLQSTALLSSTLLGKEVILACTYGGSGNPVVKFFLDGKIFGEPVAAVVAPDHSASIGTVFIGGRDNRIHSLETAAVYMFNYALSAEQMETLAKKGLSESDKWGSDAADGCVFALEPENIRTDKWYDESPNNSHISYPAGNYSFARPLIDTDPTFTGKVTSTSTTGPQFDAAYSESVKTTFETDSAGNLEIAPTGDEIGITGAVNATTGFKVNGVAGVDGTFTTADGKTVTVTKGIITAIV
jgi:hypothetical protein